ncbi:MAG: cyclase family protein [Deltaproteobacteria bacterium]|nr:cyclase family protein [Deltaproteobacteria bacterium]MCK5709869.1 cyclase family protein [Deltaproteobacteria bacterium]
MKNSISTFFVLVFVGLVLGNTDLAYSESENLTLAQGKWIDLTHDFSSETVYWPTAEGFKLERVFEGITDKGYFYDANNYSAAEHGGTHIDSPIHFAEGKQTVDEIPLEKLIGPAIVIDVTQKAIADPDYQIGVKDFTDWEARNGRIEDGSIVLLNTGYAKYWPDRVKYMGTDNRGSEAVGDLHFPGLDPQAAKWLVEKRNINAIGLDTPSIDFGQSQLFESHRILFKENIPAFENVANLDKLPAKGAIIIALPMKIKGGSGGPLRIIAMLPEENDKE